MTAMWEKLIILLNQTLEVYQALLKLSRKKRDILIEAKPQEIEMLTKQEEILIIEAGKLEIMRSTLTHELAAAIGLAPDETTMSTLIERADNETAGKLILVIDRFGGITSELTKMNELNTQLIQQSLDLINFNINILSQSAAETTYAPKGNTAPTARNRSILDTKA
ncbi:flagellar protein FlgN [Sporomusa malonica]|uniref:Flagellar biosynthesis/type III secretory pathway chaperone n=1 Tax=Sporomusa malonica TaxID=112901 RepID=A0A1W1YUB5_9FIRM|nr:flagellar protein FlgN [Sporomusa malonica]SMC39795.1 Flagellar biosynthesis/type III secretory pathway chaperone [Sporomusa malonica]